MLLNAELSLTGRSCDVRYGGIRDHRAAAMISHHRSDDRNSDSKGDKYPANSVNLRHVLMITRLVQVCH